MNKKIKKTFKKYLRKVIKNHIIDPTPSETVIGTTVLSAAAISAIMIGAGGAHLLLFLRLLVVLLQWERFLLLHI